MPFIRKQVYAGNGQLRRKRRSDPDHAPVHVTHAEREKWLGDTFADAVRLTLADPNVQFSKLTRLLDDPRFGVSHIVDTFPWEVFERKFREAEQIVLDQLRDGGTATAAASNFTFDARDPEVLIYGAKHAAEMVTNITETQRRELRNLVMSSHLRGIAPKTLAKDIRLVVGLTPAWQQAVVKFHHGLLDKGVDPKFAAKQAEKYSARLLKTRSEMIARTEVMRAENYGKILGWKQAISYGMLSPGGKKTWHTAITNVCPICLPMDGTAIDLDSNFMVSDGRKGWSVLVPPAHPNCRCTITYAPPSIEDVLDGTGLTIESLMAEITEGTYQPEDEDNVSDPADELNSEAENVTSPAIPDPPRFRRTSEAETWAREHLSDTGRTETVRMVVDTLPADVEAYMQWVVQRMKADYGPDYQVSAYDFDNPALIRIYGEQNPDSRHRRFWRDVERPVARFISFEDLNLDVAQEMVDAAVDYARTSPEVWTNITRYGTLQAIYRDQPELPNKIPGGTYAQATDNSFRINNTLGVNKVWFSTKGLPRYKAQFANDVQTGWHPAHPAVSAIRATLDHEFAHIITYTIVRRQKVDPAAPKLIDYLSRYTGQPESFWNLSDLRCRDFIARNLSRYATKNWDEFVSEAYTAGLNDPDAAAANPLVNAVMSWVRDSLA